MLIISVVYSKLEAPAQLTQFFGVVIILTLAFKPLFKGAKALAKGGPKLGEPAMTKQENHKTEDEKVT